MYSHVVVALLQKETQGFGEHIASELDSVALRRQATVPVSGGQHALSESVMAASHVSREAQIKSHSEKQ